MKIAMRLAAVCVMVLLAGCILKVKSLEPCLTEKDLVYVPSLAGTWANDDKKMLVVFEPIVPEAKSDATQPATTTTQPTTSPGIQAYFVHLTEIEGDKRRTGKFAAPITRIGKTLYVDLSPLESTGMDSEKISETYTAHLRPVHSFWKILQTEPTLIVLNADAKHWKELIDADPAALPAKITVSKRSDNENEPDVDILLTASTEQIRAFLIAHEADEKLFQGDKDIFNFTKISAATQPSTQPDEPATQPATTQPTTQAALLR